MDSASYILPWVMILFAGVLALSIKLLSIKRILGYIALGITLLIMLMMAGFEMYLASRYKHQLAEQAETIQTMEDWKYQHLNELSYMLARQNPPSDEDIALIREVKSYGFKVDHPFIMQMREAHQAREQLKSELPVIEQARYLIKGIPNAVDTSLIEFGLRELGYLVVPYREDEEPLQEVNVIYFGSEVDALTLKLTALTLMQAGIEIKDIKPFNADTKGNLRAVRLEWNRFFETRPAMEVKDIVKRQQFQ